MRIRPSELQRERLAARGLTRAPKPEFVPYVWRGDDSPVIGRDAPHVKLEPGPEKDDREQA